MTTRSDIVKRAQSLIGRSRSDGSHKYIIDTYNRHKPLARNYKVKYTDEYCATTVSSVFIKEKAVNLIGGTECSVQRFIDIFKKKGIWEENGEITPKAGDIICYNWDDGTQPNDGWADHIGIVERVENKQIIVIEGNMGNGYVGRREIPIGWGYIRGYARPKYASSKPAKPTKPTKPTKPSKGKKSLDVIAKEVIDGKWGNGAVRKARLKRAGYNYKEVQKRVNKRLNG